jgi:hypothetical protein
MFEQIDNSLKVLFQKEITITLRNKPYKKGRLINYRFNGCYISFSLNTVKKKEVFEIPFPFTVKAVPGLVTFDYTLHALAEQDMELEVNLKSVGPIKKCKFYNTVMTITH